MSSYFGKLETKLRFFRTDKRSLFKGVVKVLFSCHATVDYSRFPKIKSLNTHRYLPPEHQKRLQQQLQELRVGLHRRHLYPRSAIFTVLAQDSKADGGYFVLPRTTHLLCVQRSGHILAVSSVDDTNKRWTKLTHIATAR